MLQANILHKILLDAKKILKENDIETYSLDAELLLCHVLNFERIKLVTNDNYKLDEKEVNEYNCLINERIQHKPIAYIINKQEFMGLNFYVDENVLIPRPDTEILVEEVLKHIKPTQKILEIGTGTGCISISIKHYKPEIYLTATDISKQALGIAQKNAGINNVKINFILSDLFEDIDVGYDIIVSNPPYISKEEMKTLKQNVLIEPHLALIGDYELNESGLYYYTKIIELSKDYLNENGMIFFEVAYNQANAVGNLFKKNCFKNIKVIKDLAGKDRVVYATKQ